MFKILFSTFNALVTHYNLAENVTDRNDVTFTLLVTMKK